MTKPSASKKPTFPNIGEKYTFTPLFTAKHTMKNEPKVPKKVLFIYSNLLEKRIRKVLRLTRSKYNLGVGGAWNAYNLITLDKKLLVVKLPLGAAFTAATMEEAIYLGGKDFLIIGAAGGIKRDILVSDLVLCTKAIRDEGASHHYIKPSKYSFPDKKLSSELGQKLIKKRIRFYEGITWTTDAPYVETKEEINHYRNEGVVTVEMEASAFFAVAKRRKVRAAAIFTISDVLADRWTGFIDHDYTTNGYRKLANVAKIFKDL